jgi:hypothetical protein
MIKLTAIFVAALLAPLLLLTGCGSSSKPADPTAYSIKVFNGWPQVKKEEKVGGYVENAWRDPESPIIAVDSRPSEETGSPMANAELAQIQTYELPGYEEKRGGLKKVKLGSRPAIRFAYYTAEERSGIDFFFEECGISFVVRGTMGQVAFAALSESVQEMAETIKVKGCSE